MRQHLHVRPGAVPRALAVLAAAAVVALAGAPPAAAQSLEEFEAKTTEHVLDNGWTFIIVERPVAPVFSFATYVGVGSVEEVPGITGLAHMFEHMAFKGTSVIGTSDYEAEKAAIEKIETTYRDLAAARAALEPDAERVAELEAAFQAALEAAEQYVVANEFGEIIDREGGVGLNAFTSADVTGYFYSLPANKLELFALLESERFLDPVFRQFYQERDVVQEERRLRTESQPIGRLIEQFLAVAFTAHPYGQPTVGYMSDLQSFTMTDAERFFDTYYVPSNMVTVVVGDVDPKRVIQLAERYFGRIPAGEPPPPVRTVEPASIAEKVVRIPDPAQPFYIEGYLKPPATHPDQAIYDAIDDILSNGRTSRLYRRLVEDEKIAVAAASFSGLPGDQFKNLWMAYAVPAKDVENEEVQAAIREEIERLKTELVTDEELARFKTRAKADLIRGLRSNQGLANQLAEYQTLFGDWRALFRYIDAIEKVTKEDVQRVARETFVPTNRTVGMIVTQPAA
ncbi:MAG TPA: pitrilysin family protein, partial [Thermoanaerobaculia bacterium]|nr:pitrilysin family protein [Thermoanaerobaculia bacterium]